VRPAWPLLAVILAAGCSFDTSGVSGGAADAAADAGTPDAPGPDAAPCSGTGKMCLGATRLQECVGGFFRETECSFGCLANPDAHCGVPVLSNGLALTALNGADASLVVAAGTVVVFDTTTGAIAQCGGATLHGPSTGIDQGINFEVVGPVGVWAFANLRVEATATLRVIGDKPAALLLGKDARVEGVIEASGGVAACNFVTACLPGADRTCGGPGGGAGGVHDADGAGAGHGHKGVSGGAAVDETGGGGAGFGAVGGGGGGLIGAEAGASYGTPELEPLVGGSGGGGGGEAISTSVNGGGGGGGALQISALGRIEVLAPVGKVRAGGAGGGGGSGDGGASNGGSGGGSGGAILLESVRVKITSIVAANGGGGGGGGGSATAGTNSLASAANASGGTGAQPGGQGGAAASINGAPGSPAVAADGTGGGGGGVGRIFLRARPGGIELPGATVSPAPGQGALRVQ